MIGARSPESSSRHDAAASEAVESGVVLLPLVLAASALAADVPEVEPGTPIVAIRVVRHDVFDVQDPATSAWFYRWAVALHVLTRERFIRSLLLFRVGDALDPPVLAESERLLRANGFLQPVTITAHAVAGGAEVVVETHDQWTTLLGTSAGVLGNRHHVGISFEEDNLLGWGKQLLFAFDSSTERTTRLFKYTDPLVLGTRWQLAAAHTANSDGTSDQLTVAYPFFALATPRAAGVSWQRGDNTEWLYVAGEKAVAGTLVERGFRLWAGHRLPFDGGTTQRLTLALFKDKRRYSGWHWLAGGSYPTPEDVDLAGIEIGWQLQVDRWRVLRGFRVFQRQEDVQLGPAAYVSIGFSGTAFDGDRQRLPFSGGLSVASLRGRQFSWLNASVSGRFEQGAFADTVTHLEVGTSLTGTAGWRGRLALDLGHELGLDRQLTLGALTGLRGWNPDYFDGTSRAVANLEWRRQLTGELLHLGVIGMIVLADVGRTWNGRVGPDTGGWRSDVGVGLHIEPTRASLVRVIRVEVAKPLGPERAVFLATSESLF